MVLPSLTQPKLCISWLLSLVEAPPGTSVESHLLQSFSDSLILSERREGEAGCHFSVFLWLWYCPWLRNPWGKPWLCILRVLPVWYQEALGGSCVPTLRKVVLFICQVEAPFCSRNKLKVEPDGVTAANQAWPLSHALIGDPGLDLRGAVGRGSMS